MMPVNYHSTLSFGEDKDEVCGVCDICLANKGKNNSASLEELIIKELEKEVLTYKALSDRILKFSKEEVISKLREMDEQGTIAFDGDLVGLLE
jgi:hypothetical protein